MSATGDSSDTESKQSQGEVASFVRMYREAAPYLALGVQLAATVVMLFYVGYWADEEFGTKPWLMIVGIAIGSGAGFYNFFRTVIALGKKSEGSIGEDNVKK